MDLSRQLTGDELKIDFPRADVHNAAPIGESVEFRITGLMDFGCDFEAVDYVRVIDEGQAHSTAESELDPSTVLDDAIRGGVAQLTMGTPGDVGNVDCLPGYQSNFGFELNSDPAVPLPGEVLFYLYKFCHGTATCTYGQATGGATRTPSSVSGAGCP